MNYFEITEVFYDLMCMGYTSSNLTKLVYDNIEQLIPDKISQLLSAISDSDASETQKLKRELTTKLIELYEKNFNQIEFVSKVQCLKYLTNIDNKRLADQRDINRLKRLIVQEIG